MISPEKKVEEEFRVLGEGHESLSQVPEANTCVNCIFLLPLQILTKQKNQYTKVIFLCEQKTLHTYSSKAFIYYASLGTKEFNPQTGHTVICK